MRNWTVSLILLVAPLIPLSADIYVDFTISHDGEVGTFRARLFHEQVPRVCANFIGLATGERAWLDPRTHRLREGVPFYDGLTFHRLIHDFVIQGGDPLGTGGGGPGYVFQDQFHPDLRHDGRYLLSMAHAGAHTNGSQFFITLEETPFLDDYHSVFGEVIEGRDVIDGFADPGQHPVDENERPVNAIVMDSVVVSGPALEGFMAAHAQAELPQWKPVNKEISYSMVDDGDGGTRPALRLHWHRRAQWDYPLLGSQTLEVADHGAEEPDGPDYFPWITLGFGLSVDDEPDFFTDVTGVFAEDPDQNLVAFPAFFQVLGLDYSHLPTVPQSMIAAGTEIRLSLPEGTLRLGFEGEEDGSWTFEPADGSAVASGAIEDFSEDPESAVPEEGFFIGGDDTLASLLARRTVTVFFDESVGPYGWTAVQPTLSFHEEGKGWFNGPVNADNPANVPFRGQFEITFP
ncbi:MAG: peptidylprolyl isomerase [Opitutales bacterium]|nr:peptidylprolyl isomerase [Opitutales bacterium]